MAGCQVFGLLLTACRLECQMLRRDPYLNSLLVSSQMSINKSDSDNNVTPIRPNEWVIPP